MLHAVRADDKGTILFEPPAGLAELEPDLPTRHLDDGRGGTFLGEATRRLPGLGALNLEARRSTDEIDVIDVEANPQHLLQPGKQACWIDSQ